MRSAIWVIAALAAGCAVDPVDDEALSSADQNVLKCPSENCGVGNGGGIYTEENAFAGFGPNQAMITTFVNNATSSPSDVHLVTRQFLGNTMGWVVKNMPNPLVRIGTELSTYKLLGVTEKDTKVLFWVAGLAAPVSPTKDKPVHLAFDGAGLLTLTPVDNKVSRSINTYAVVWNSTLTYNPATATSYCFRSTADGSSPDYTTPDPVVFQQGISPDPVTGVVGVFPKDTTMSCLHGAIAISYSWGYKYVPGSDTTMFESALQMKRASYCGDAGFYTHRGVRISIWDSLGINASDIPKETTEAKWGRGPSGHVRALCVTKNNMRSRCTTYPPSGANTGSGADGCGSAPGRFKGVCTDPSSGTNYVIPECADYDEPSSHPVKTLDAFLDDHGE